MIGGGREGRREKDGEREEEGLRGMVKGLNLSVCVCEKRRLCMLSLISFVTLYDAVQQQNSRSTCGFNVWLKLHYRMP